MAAPAPLSSSVSAQAVIDVDVDGVAGAGYGNEKRRVETYRELAEQVVKLIKKAR